MPDKLSRIEYNPHTTEPLDHSYLIIVWKQMKTNFLKEGFPKLWVRETLYINQSSKDAISLDENFSIFRNIKDVMKL